MNNSSLRLGYLSIGFRIKQGPESKFGPKNILRNLNNGSPALVGTNLETFSESSSCGQNAEKKSKLFGRSKIVEETLQIRLLDAEISILNCQMKNTVLAWILDRKTAFKGF